MKKAGDTVWMSHYGSLYRNNYRSIDTKGAHWLARTRRMPHWRYTGMMRVREEDFLVPFARIVSSLFPSIIPFFLRSIYAKEARARDREMRGNEITYTEGTEDMKEKRRDGKRKRERDKPWRRRSWKSRLFVCQERSFVRTNKWKQIISWPHYEKESMASREDSMCAVGVARSLSLSLPLLVAAAPGRQ